MLSFYLCTIKNQFACLTLSDTWTWFSHALSAWRPPSLPLPLSPPLSLFLLHGSYKSSAFGQANNLSPQLVKWAGSLSLSERALDLARGRHWKLLATQGRRSKVWKWKENTKGKIEKLCKWPLTKLRTCHNIVVKVRGHWKKINQNIGKNKRKIQIQAYLQGILLYLTRKKFLRNNHNIINYSNIIC